MRPCNQCGTPVGNKRIVCDECQRSNEETGYQPKVSVRPFGPDNLPMNPEPEYSTSFGQVGNAFLLICMVLGGTTAYVLGGNTFVIVVFAVLALVVSYSFFRMMI